MCGTYIVCECVCGIAWTASIWIYTCMGSACVCACVCVYEVDSSNGCCNVRAKLTGSRNNNNETAAYPFPLVCHLPTPYPHCPTHHLQLSVARKWHSQALLTIHSTRFSDSVSYYVSPVVLSWTSGVDPEAISPKHKPPRWVNIVNVKPKTSK